MNINTKKTCVISCPIDTYSGYGARSRDFVKGLIEEYPDYQYTIIPQRWGNTPWNYIEDHKDEWGFLFDYVIKEPLTVKPDIYITISVPNEFQPHGHFNIGVTAGIETTLVHQDWILGCNRMDMIIVPSEHSKKSFEDSVYEQKMPSGERSTIRLNVPMEVVFEGVHVDKYLKPLNPESNVSKVLDCIKEDFNFLVVGHWLPGDVGEDRKNIGLTIKTFYDTYKNTKNAPGLILKVGVGSPSPIAREAILRRIESISKEYKNCILPSVYLLHADLNEDEVSDLYNHPKVKAMVSLTKGEGFGRPLLEFSLTGKPIMVSGWSGHVDFIRVESQIGGKLKNVHPSAVLSKMIIQEAAWFSPDEKTVKMFYEYIRTKYKNSLEIGKRQSYLSRTKFSYDAMKKVLREVIDKHYKEQPKFQPLNLQHGKLPELKNVK